MSNQSSQHWNPDQYAEHARFVSDLGLPVVELLSPIAGERILDLGCGDGALTIKLLNFGCEIVGVDSSPEMINAARSLGLQAEVMAGDALQFDTEFDAVFSNAALHWMTNPKKVIDGVWRALKPGGRFVGEFGGHGNVSSIVAAIEEALSSRGVAVPNPWFFPRIEEYQQLLRLGGFYINHMVHFSRPTPLPGNVRGWLETFAQPYTSDLPDHEKSVLLSEVAESLRPVLIDENENWVADYVRLRFSATKPIIAS